METVGIIGIGSALLCYAFRRNTGLLIGFSIVSYISLLLLILNLGIRLLDI